MEIPKKLTDFKWLNLYEIQGKIKDKDICWQYASRKSNPNKPDAVCVVVHFNGKLVLTKEYRLPIQDYEYSFPSGLIDLDEDPITAAKRELKEETGLDLEKVSLVSPPLYSSAGMTDESIIMVIGEASGTPNVELQEESEDIELIFLDDDNVDYFLYDCSKGNIKISVRAWLILQLVKYWRYKKSS